ncbi:C39 family peptidase [Eupransor demetentiae]|uniref:Glucan-binding domain (YG repeat) n=1 Tax=Eupransor demetentiae TaxID=3109584 RepID=A0ABP0EMG0_9LACO|nr:Glucan-binding domain (YG repeat) [Lactobacillaceae bacterium LMG 33000]
MLKSIYGLSALGVAGLLLSGASVANADSNNDALPGDPQAAFVMPAFLPGAIWDKAAQEPVSYGNDALVAPTNSNGTEVVPDHYIPGQTWNGEKQVNEPVVTSNNEATPSSNSANASTNNSTSVNPHNIPGVVRDVNKFATNNGDVYYFGNNGEVVTGDQTINGHQVHFFNDGKLDWNSVNVDLPHDFYNQNEEGAPEGCEGTSFQMALSAKGKQVPSLKDIYNTIGYGWDVPANEGFHGNPFGWGADETQTVLAAPLANKLNDVYGVKTVDMTGASIGDVISQLMQGNPVITYIPWDLKITGKNNLHVQVITGYANGNFIIADPLRHADYQLPVDDWYYLNQNIQPLGFSAPQGMNVAVQ